ncbi:MAG: DoxX family protein [Bacteroidota bacterium]
MNKILNVNNNTVTTGIALLVARVGIAALMLTHGIPKLMLLVSGAPIQFPAVMGLSASVSLGLAVFSEVVCSIFILLGLGTRLATIPLIVTMMIAALFIHAADPIAIKESALHYLLVYVFLLIAGGGKYSLDFLLSRSSKVSIAEKPQSSTPSFAVINS